jgi:ATP-dependent exoDNAse (exonuclease V) alpha subunit
MEDTNERIKNIVNDTELLKESMEIINELVLAQEEKINFIEDEIKESLCEVKEGEKNIIISNEYKDYNLYNNYIYYIGGIIGAGIVYLFI